MRGKYPLIYSKVSLEKKTQIDPLHNFPKKHLLKQQIISSVLVMEHTPQNRRYYQLLKRFACKFTAMLSDPNSGLSHA